MKKIFIDGSAGTTGLKIVERLALRSDLELIRLPEELRKDTAARKEALNSADVVFLCLPDAAAIEAADMVENPDTVVIDTSTAHRTNPDWTYGFAEINNLRERIAAAKRIANPGCHASGFIALVAPLRAEGIIDENALLTCFSLTGYSGGGKKMIADYESQERSPLLDAPRMYGLTQQHKHLPEMAKVCGLAHMPAFCPIVGDFYSGMEVTVPLFKSEIGKDLQSVADAYLRYYGNDPKKPVYFNANADEAGFLSAAAFSGKDSMEISVSGSDERILLTARFDNLGKGASGAAIQNMNIAIGAEETLGLIL